LPAIHQFQKPRSHSVNDQRTSTGFPMEDHNVARMRTRLHWKIGHRACALEVGNIVLESKDPELAMPQWHHPPEIKLVNRPTIRTQAKERIAACTVTQSIVVFRGCNGDFRLDCLSERRSNCCGAGNSFDFDQ